MLVENFTFDLPPERIALYPAMPRDSAKLLVVGHDKLHDSSIADLSNYFQAGDGLVVNNSYVVPARLTGKTQAGEAIDVLLCQPLDAYRWHVMMKGSAEKITFSPNINARFIEKGQVEFNVPFTELYPFIEKFGTTPLPPYIENKREVEKTDRALYQTIYHKKQEAWGSIAAPTAGLHFTDKVFAQLKAKGVEILELTLHVGIGTFLPIRSQEVEAHAMLPERAFLSQAVADKINQIKNKGGRLIAVGTTSARVLESAATDEGHVIPFNGESQLFIYPSYSFKVIDGLLTNFHLPRSTPLLLVSALMGWQRIKEAYQHAIAKDYRFFSYGDACLLLPS